MLQEGSRSSSSVFVGVRLTGDRLGWNRRDLEGVLMGLEGTLDEGVGGVVTEALALDFLSLLADLLSSSEKKRKINPLIFFSQINRTHHHFYFKN